MGGQGFPDYYDAVVHADGSYAVDLVVGSLRVGAAGRPLAIRVSDGHASSQGEGVACARAAIRADRERQTRERAAETGAVRFTEPLEAPTRETNFLREYLSEPD